MNSLTRTCAIVIGISMVVFALMQLLFGSAHCFDCGARIGFPFSYMQEGTFSTLGQFIWLGFLGDCAVALGISTSAMWLWRRRKPHAGKSQLTEADEKVRHEKLLEFLNSKEPAWRDEDHPELKDGAAAWVRKIRSEWHRPREGEKD